MKQATSSQRALNLIRYVGGGLFLLGIACLAVLGALEETVVSRNFLIVLSTIAILAVFGAIVVVSIYLKPLLLDLIGQKYDRINANPVASVAAPSDPEALRKIFHDLGFVEDGDLLYRTVGRLVFAASIRRSADFTKEVGPLVDRFDRFVGARGKKSGKRRVLFAVYYMSRVAPDDFNAAKTLAADQRTIASFLPVATDTIIPILYDETVQAFRFLDGGTSHRKSYDVALRFFTQHILG